MLNAIKNKKELLQQYIIYHSVQYITGLIVWAYYYILLYKATNSLTILILDRFIYFIGLWIGFIFASFCLDRIGYLKAFKINALLNILLMVVMILFINKLADYFVVLAVLRGIAMGTYWPVSHSFNLKEVHGKGRGVLISEVFGLDMIFAIFIPIMAGSLIDFTNNYQYIFLIGFLLYLVSYLLPYKYNKSPRSRVRGEEITRILKHKSFIPYAVFIITSDGISQLMGSLFTIIPFLLIGSEFGVGALGTAIGVFAALTAIVKRNEKMEAKIKETYFAYSIYFIATTTLAFIWNFPVIIIRSLLMPIIDAVGNTTYTNLDYQVREKILGDFKNESVVEMNIIVESLFFLGRFISSIIILAILANIKFEKSLEVVRIIIAILSIAPLINIFIITKFNKTIKKG